MDIPREALLEMYRRMVRIRQFELTAIDLFKRGQVKGAITAYVGQEASGVGVCMALRRDDLVASTHRSHGHNLAKGATSRRVMAEVLGKQTGYCQGRGGSMHVAAFDTGSLGALAVVGAGMPIAVGAALGFQMKGEDRVVVPFTGDGATNTGSFHESLNLAAVWKVPVIFVVENNQYAVSTRIRNMVRIEDLSLRGASYGIPGVRVDGNDVVAVYQATVQAVARARQGEGPTLLVTETYRLGGHYAGEPEVYRTRAEVEEHEKGDPLTRFRSELLSTHGATETEVKAIETEIDTEMVDAVRFARESPEPDPATAMDYIYAEQ